MKNKSSLKLEISIFGDSFDLDNLTKSLKMEPTSKWNKGEKNPNHLSPPRQETSWNLEFYNSSRLDLEIVTEELISKMEPHIQIINNFSNDNDLIVKLFLLIEVSENNKPALYLNSKFIAFLSRINAELDIDYYFY
jgi:hypothetical protein